MHMFMYVRMCVCVYVCPSSPALFPSSPALFPSAPALFPSSPALFPIYIYMFLFCLLQFMTMTLPNFLHAVSGRKPL